MSKQSVKYPRSVLIKLPTDLYEKLKTLAQHNERSVSGHVRHMIKRAWVSMQAPEEQ
jgi:predicted DNA-binding protein